MQTEVKSEKILIDKDDFNRLYNMFNRMRGGLWGLIDMNIIKSGGVTEDMLKSADLISEELEWLAK